MNQENIFVLHKGTIYQVDTESGAYKKLSYNWDNTTCMAESPTKLYAVDQACIYEIDKASGDHRILTDDNWTGSSLMVYKNNMLYVLHKKTLYKVHPETGAYEELSDDGWDESTFMI